MTAREWIDARADELGVDLLVMDGYDDCIAGIVEQHGSEPCVAYYREKVLSRLIEEGMSY
jgi:hypothetical protein